MSMAIDAKALGLHRMSVEERLELLDLLLDSLEADGVSPELSADQVAELERRVVDMDANPDDVVDWQEVESQALARIRK
jgi:putative addiction module component (TIGR02574 family)